MVALIIMSVVRELLGTGKFGGGVFGPEGFGFGTASGFQVFPESFAALGMILPVGGFLTLGFIIAGFQYILNKPKKKEVDKG